MGEYLVPGRVFLVLTDEKGVEIHWADRQVVPSLILRLPWEGIEPLVDTLLMAMFREVPGFRDKLMRARFDQGPENPHVGMGQGEVQQRFVNPPLQVGGVKVHGEEGVDQEFARRLQGRGDMAEVQCVQAVRDCALGKLSWDDVSRICKEWEYPLQAAEGRYVNGLQRRFNEGSLEGEELRQLLAQLDMAKVIK